MSYNVHISLMVFLKEVFEKLILKKNPQTTKNVQSHVVLSSQIVKLVGGISSSVRRYHLVTLCPLGNFYAF